MLSNTSSSEVIPKPSPQVCQSGPGRRVRHLQERLVSRSAGSAPSRTRYMACAFAAAGGGMAASVMRPPVLPRAAPLTRTTSKLCACAIVATAPCKQQAKKQEAFNPCETAASPVVLITKLTPARDRLRLGFVLTADVHPSLRLGSFWQKLLARLGRCGRTH